jgi:queuine tRNA-ribosyltransferase accessory subunit
MFWRPLCKRSLEQLDVLKQFEGEPREYLALDQAFALIATPRDPCIFEYQGTLRSATDNHAAVYGTQGALSVTPEQYMEAVGALKPDIVVALSDEVPSDSKHARAVASVNRTIAWIDRCLASQSATSQPIIACIQGAQYLAERQRCIAAINARMHQLAGVCVAGLGTGESSHQRFESIAEVMSSVPRDKLRMVSSIGTPTDILSAVAQGVDLFDMGFLAAVTAGGYALSFPLDPKEAEGGMFEGAPGEGMVPVGHDGDASSVFMDRRAAAGENDTKINLWATAHCLDKGPLVAGCPCAACRQHSRGYIHHLLNCHEMTAQVLLEAHNTTHYLRFFAAIRRAIANGSFSEYRDWFAERRRRWMMGASAS